MLSWSEQELPQKQRTKHVHGLHPYMGKFVPQIVDHFLSHELKNSKFILDPFVGSGTTLVESNIHGKTSVGLDVSLFNTILCKVKTAEYDFDLLEFEINDIFKKTIKSKRELVTNSKYILKWYHPEAILPLLRFKSLIKNYHYQDVLKVILSRAARSSRMVPHYEVDFPKHTQDTDYYCLKHSRICHPTKNSEGFLKRYCKDTLIRLLEFSKSRNMIFTKALHEDARSFKFDSPSIDGLITSPPYVGLIDYHEQHKYAYEFLNLKDNSSDEIGMKSKGFSKISVRQYSQDISKVFKNIADNCSRIQTVIIIVNDKHNIYDDLLSDAGITIKNREKRRVDRRSGRRGKGYYEDILICNVD